MQNAIYCSTGCLIGRANSCDWRLVIDYSRDISVRSYEFMMLTAYYGQFDEIARTLNRADISFPVLHTDKNIGTKFSIGTPEEVSEAYRLFDENCALAKNLGAKKVVLHLWGGIISDSKFAFNAECFEKIFEISNKYGVTVAVENIPCTFGDPLTHWDELSAEYPEVKFIYDTRFGGFHGQLDQFANSPRVYDGSVIHMHVSDFTGPPMDFKTLRPILHPHEGIVDFEKFFGAVAPKYTESITLESPVLSSDGVDLNKLNNTLSFINKCVNTYTNIH